MRASTFTYFIALGLIAIGLELHWRHRHKISTDWRSARLSIATGAARFLIGLALHILFLANLYELLSGLAPWHLPASWLVWIVYFLLADFWNYWFHRLSHRVGFLWAAHVVHHSTVDFNFTAATRLSPIEVLWHPLLGVWALVLGFPLSVTAAISTLDLTLALFNHTDMPIRLGWLDRWFATPSAHRVHHGKNERYLDKNFGTVLLVWDKIFGTFEPEIEPVEYGAIAWSGRESLSTLLVGGYAQWWTQRSNTNP